MVSGATEELSAQTVKRSTGEGNEENIEPLVVTKVDEKTGTVEEFVDLKKLPEFRELNDKINEIVDSSSYWERFGLDMAEHQLILATWLASYYLLSYSNPLIFATGVFVNGTCFTAILYRAGHTAFHNTLCLSPFWSKFWAFVYVDFIGNFGLESGIIIHIRRHHPHINIIGRGDALHWRAPRLNRYVYMFVLPFLLPAVAPIQALKEMKTQPRKKLLTQLAIILAGFTFQMTMLMVVSQFTFWPALLTLFGTRTLYAIPFLHINIFQHTGLNMYSHKHRPKRLYQVTNSCLNLPRNPLLDFTFGHQLVSCHTVHHLFPHLSDNMCLKVEPTVRNFCKEHDLPYHIDTYWNRTRVFLEEYDSLMVNAPPVTHFIGVH